MMPALNEEQALPFVLHDLATLQTAGVVHEVIVVDNGSHDRSAEIARSANATVLHEPQRGYGAACLCGIAHLRPEPPDVLVFMDADRSDDAREIPSLVQPILAGDADLVIGSRTLGQRERGALTPQARFGNWLATRLIRWQYGFQYTDLGPFRAVRFAALEQLGMRDRDFGWTVEMQVRALQHGLRVVEVPVSYRRRIGRSKISGTVSGSVKAGVKILSTLWKLRASDTPGNKRRAHQPSR
jgi:glycosyltransferase involved in cell wall biosynthesis